MLCLSAAGIAEDRPVSPRCGIRILCASAARRPDSDLMCMLAEFDWRLGFVLGRDCSANERGDVWGVQKYLKRILRNLRFPAVYGVGPSPLEVPRVKPKQLAQKHAVLARESP